MKALIFNSGLGSRLGALTADRPKALVRLGNGETIFHRQLRILHACGVDEFVVTTGPWPDRLAAEAAAFGAAVRAESVSRGETGRAGESFSRGEADREAGCASESFSRGENGREETCVVTFVPNPLYDRTNYLYSMWLAGDLVRGDDILMLHGDLVFDAAYAQMVIDSDLPSLGSVNAALPLPQKDFKARVEGGEVREVSVRIFDGDCVAFQPFYKLSAETLAVWLDAVDRFVDAGDVKAYAENAANAVFDKMHVAAFSYEGHYVEEVDTPDDLERVSAGIRLHDFAQQPIFGAGDDGFALVDGVATGALRNASSLRDVLAAFGCAKPLVVAGSHFEDFPMRQQLIASGVDYEVFGGFSPNPTFEQVKAAVAAFRSGGCDSLLSISGGSAMDVAKCAKQLLAMPEEADGFDLKAGNMPYSGIPHVAIPTTAGTGSESTHFAVCYVEGVKVSVANDCLVPDAVVLDARNLAGLSDYQRKCTMLDALCQAIESYWSRRSCEESRVHAACAIRAIVSNADAYLAGDAAAGAAIMRAANQAGKAINLTTTTAPHAMSYKLTSLYRIPHGHAVALCMPHCWRVLLERADDGLRSRLAEIAALMCGRGQGGASEGVATSNRESAACATGPVESSRVLDAPGFVTPTAKAGLDVVSNPEESSITIDPTAGLAAFERFFAKLGIDATIAGTEGDVETLATSVNAQRLANFPIQLTYQDIADIYRRVIAISALIPE